MPAALRLALVALLVATRITTAQETATEQVAAADVIRRMSELERSLALPQLVARLAGARDARRDAVIARAKDLMDRELLAMADDITRHPETGWKEERSVKILTDYLTAHGFDVEPGVAGLKTAFVAHYRKGTPGPNLGVIVEYDALRGTSRDFHGDQHSAQGPVGLAAAIAVAEFLTSSKTPGTVTVYGTPAEELASPAAKTLMYNAGVFKGADVLIRSHSSTATQAPSPGFGSCCMNINVVHYTFSGAPAHQLQAWDGRDALMGVIELFNHIDGLRKTLRPETKIQGIITEGGKAPNVVPDRAAAEFWIRYPDPVYLAQVTERVNDAARGSGLATGTKVRSEEHTSELQSRSDLVCRLLLEKKKQTTKLQSRSDLLSRLLLEKKKRRVRACTGWLQHVAYVVVLPRDSPHDSDGIRCHATATPSLLDPPRYTGTSDYLRPSPRHPYTPLPN